MRDVKGDDESDISESNEKASTPEDSMLRDRASPSKQLGERMAYQQHTPLGANPPRPVGYTPEPVVPAGNFV